MNSNATRNSSAQAKAYLENAFFGQKNAGNSALWTNLVIGNINLIRNPFMEELVAQLKSKLKQELRKFQQSDGPIDVTKFISIVTHTIELMGNNVLEKTQRIELEKQLIICYKDEKVPSYCRDYISKTLQLMRTNITTLEKEEIEKDEIESR